MMHDDESRVHEPEGFCYEQLHICCFAVLEARQCSSNLEVFLFRYTDVTLRLVVRDPAARFFPFQNPDSSGYYSNLLF